MDSRTWWNEKLPQWIANHLPKSVVYFAVIRCWGKAGCTEFEGRPPDGIDLWEALGCWERS